MAGEPETELVRRAQEGSREAFAELVKTHRPRIYLLAYGMLDSPSDADDAVQETLIAAIKALPQFRADSSFATWLHSIAVRRCLDFLRRRKHEVLLDSAVVDRRDPFVNKLEQASLLSALRDLPLEFRQAVLLVDVAGRTIQEASELLDTPVGTIKSRVFRGRGMLAKSLGTILGREPSKL